MIEQWFSIYSYMFIKTIKIDLFYLDWQAEVWAGLKLQISDLLEQRLF